MSIAALAQSPASESSQPRRMSSDSASSLGPGLWLRTAPRDWFDAAVSPAGAVIPAIVLQPNSVGMVTGLHEFRLVFLPDRNMLELRVTTKTNMAETPMILFQHNESPSEFPRLPGNPVLPPEVHVPVIPPPPPAAFLSPAIPAPCPATESNYGPSRPATSKALPSGPYEPPRIRPRRWHVPPGPDVPAQVVQECKALGGVLQKMSDEWSPEKRMLRAWKAGNEARGSTYALPFRAPPVFGLPPATVYAWVTREGHGHWTRDQTALFQCTGGGPYQGGNFKAHPWPSIVEAVAFLRGAGADTVSLGTRTGM